MKAINIAIDGPAGAGKSTVAKGVAKKLGYIYVDTGALYRAIGVYALRNGIYTKDAEGVGAVLKDINVELKFVDGVQKVFLCGEDVSVDIRTPEASMAASNVSAIPAVRAFLLDLQRDIAKKNNLKLPGDLRRVQQISAEENAAAVTKLIGDIHQEIARQMNKHHQVVTHYMTQHGYIPLWVLVNVLTFGKITNFYLHMKSSDKMRVAKFFSVNVKELHKYMTMLGLARNKCAHDERFYDISFRQRLHTKGIKNFSVLGIKTQPDGSYISGTNDAYAIAIIFAILLSKTDLREFVSVMKSSFAKLDKQLHTISMEDIMETMGYHKDWQNLILLKK